MDNEKSVERYLKNQAEKHGGLCMKFVSPGRNGVPDRLVLLPGGKMFFAELKAENRKPRPLQTAVHRQFEKLGFRVFVLDSKAGILKTIEEVLSSGF